MDNGVSLWPLNQITHDTQYYVRDVVIDYISAQTEPISPAIEGRLQFQTPTAVRLTQFVAESPARVAGRPAHAVGHRPYLPLILK
jgi:hypothetical protein